MALERKTLKLLDIIDKTIEKLIRVLLFVLDNLVKSLRSHLNC